MSSIIEIIGAIITAAITGFAMKLGLNIRTKKSNQTITDSTSSVAVSGNGNTIMMSQSPPQPPLTTEAQKPEPSLSSLKETTSILFIDDDTKFKIVEILKQNGWLNTKIVKDIKNLDAPDIKQAKIVFVDIIGVGKHLSDSGEGLGLVAAIKDKYPEKFAIIYSSEERQNIFHEGSSKADGRIRKNADMYQFLSLVEKFARK